ncbi:MAG: DNA polymerase III subunit beta [Rhodocyclaceae bacterium]|nr:DNA polymerase III subunit beta [Rhodocyclaceae bacterium]
MLVMQCSRDTLLRPLAAVIGIVERRNTLPILSNVLLHCSGNTLTCLATDLELEVLASAALEAATDDITFTTSARKLYDIVRALPEDAKVALDLHDGRLTIKAGRSRFTLQTLDPVTFPRMPELADTSVELRLHQGALRELLRLTQYAMAQQDIRYYLNGLLLDQVGETVRLVATDGHRLAYAEGRADGAATGTSSSTILPRKLVQELARLLSDGDEPVTLQVGPQQVRASFGDIRIASKVIDGKFPDYNRVIPQDHPKAIEVPRAVLLDALRRAEILSNDKLRSVRLLLEPGRLGVSCTNTEQEEAAEELEIDYQGESLDIGFNVQYLLEAVSTLSSEQVTLNLRDQNSSCLLTDRENPGYRYVVMPMRL